MPNNAAAVSTWALAELADDDAAELAMLAANPAERDAHNADALPDATVELFTACVTECEHYVLQGCRDTVVAARQAASALCGAADGVMHVGGRSAPGDRSGLAS